MSAQEELPLEDTGNPEVEREAREMGWTPKDDFRGNPEKWVDAATFVERGKHVMPLLRKENERQEAKLRTLANQVANLTSELTAARADLENFQEFHVEEVNRRVEEVRRDLKSRIKQAKQDDDVDTEIELTAELANLNAADRETKAAVKANGKDEQPPPQYDPSKDTVLQAWSAKNSWFGGDQVGDIRRTHEAIGVGREINLEMPNLKGQAFYDELDRRLGALHEEPSGVARSKVERSRGGATSSRADGHTFSNLPAEAKKICDEYANRLVNPNGKWKTVADYRKHYIKQLEDTGYTDWV